MPHDLKLDAAGAPQRAQPSFVGFLSLLVILTLLIGAVGGYVYNRLSEEQRHETERTLAVIAEQKRQQLESWLAQTRDDARLYFSGQALLVQRLAAWEAGGRQDLTLLELARARIADVMDVRGWSALAVLDIHGDPMITLGPTYFASHAEAVQDVLAHPRLLPIDLHPHPNGQSEYGLLAPITLPDGRLLGLAYLSWRADQSLLPLIASWPVPTQTAETYLVQREGEELLYLTPLRHDPATALNKRLPLATPHLAAALAAQGQEGILPEARDYRNQPVLAYATAIAGTPWLMIAEMDQREAQAGIRQTTKVTSLVLGLILLLTYSLAFAGWRRVRERVLASAREASARLESERRWKLALDGSGHGVWDWYLDTGRVDYSPTWKRMLGYDEVAIGDTLSAWEQLVHPEDLAWVQAARKAHLAGETPGYESVHRMRCQDGTWKWLLDRGIVLERDVTGQPRRMLGTHTDITAQKEAEADLRASEERFRYVMEATSDGIWDWNLPTGTVYYSPGWARMLGYAPEELAAELSTLAGLLHPEERDQVMARSQRLLADPGHYELEFRLCTKAGDYRWVLSRAKVVEWGSDGRPQRALGTHVDITERKARELELHRYQQTVENASDMLLFLDRDLRYRIVNPAFAALNGTTPEQIVGRRVEDVERPEVFARIRPGLEAALRGETRRHIFRRLDPAGQLRWLEGNVIPFVQDGTVAGLVVCLHDLTELYEAQAALEAERASLEEQVRTRTAELRLQSERLELAAEAGGIGIWEWDLKTGAILWDRRLRRLYGLAEDGGNPSFDTWMSWIPPADRVAIEASAAAVLRGEEELFRATFQARGPDGRPRDIASRGRLLRDAAEPSAEPSRMLGVNWDVTELKAAQARAELATRAKSEFLAQMSHEIRTPLNVVLGLAQLLGRQALSLDQYAMVQRIQDAGQSLLGIINDILDFSKIEAGQLHLDARPFRLETLTAKLASLLGATAAAKGLELRIATPPASPGPLLGDALRLEQVLINLTGNAIKFTDQGEVALRIHTLASADREVRLRFAVQDTGIGISPEIQATLFRPFTQADAGISRRFGGTGLGLAISKRLVELMGGVIGVDSQPGQGSTFWFELPFACASEAEEVSLAAAAPAGPRLRGLRLLAVDDSAMNRDLVERALALEGAKVTLAADGQQAVQYLQTPGFGCDAVLMDVRMPVMDGLTAMRYIRHELGLKDLPILALTAGVLPEEQQAARDAGANEVLAKPLNLDRLAARLAHHIGAARLAAAAAEAGPNAGEVTPATPVTQLAAAPQGVKAGPEGVSTSLFPGRGEEASVPLSPGRGEQASVSPPGGGGPGRGGEARSNALPAIPGIDRERITLMFKNDVPYYLSMLERLTQEAAAGLVQARQALATGDRETAARCLHSLKGNAGHLGALTLMAAAGKLEASLKAGATDLESGLADLERQVADLTAASARLMPRPLPIIAQGPASLS